MLGIQRLGSFKTSPHPNIPRLDISIESNMLLTI